MGTSSVTACGIRLGIEGRTGQGPGGSGARPVALGPIGIGGCCSI